MIGLSPVSVVVLEMSFKGISYLDLWRPFCSAEHKNLCYLDRGHYKELISEFGPVVQEEMLFIGFLIWSSGGPPVQWRGTIYAILK